MKYIEKVAVDYLIANVPTFLIAEMISNYLARVVNTLFKFFFCHNAKLVKIGQIHKKKPHRLLGEAGGRLLPGSVVGVEGDAGEVFGAVGVTAKRFALQRTGRGLFAAQRCG